MRKTLAILVTAAGIGALAVTAPAPADAGDVVFAPAPGPIVGAAVEVSPDYDGYIYGPLPYGPSYDPGVYDGSRVYYGPRVHRSSRIHRVARVHHVRVTRVFDPYAGGGPFYHRHYCCRYW